MSTNGLHQKTENPYFDWPRVRGRWSHQFDRSKSLRQPPSRHEGIQCADGNKLHDLPAKRLSAPVSASHRPVGRTSPVGEPGHCRQTNESAVSRAPGDHVKVSERGRSFGISAGSFGRRHQGYQDFARGLLHGAEQGGCLPMIVRAMQRRAWASSASAHRARLPVASVLPSLTKIVS